MLHNNAQVYQCDIAFKVSPLSTYPLTYPQFCPRYTHQTGDNYDFNFLNLCLDS